MFGVDVSPEIGESVFLLIYSCRHEDGALPMGTSFAHYMEKEKECLG